MSFSPVSFDIFCRVIDNYGDVGVCWRLARQLAQASRRVCLWVDDLERLRALVPGICPDAAEQWRDDVRIRRWNDAADAIPADPAQVVIEAFACDPPANFVRAMTPETLWINLEYLSAEDWVQGCHGLPSPQPGGLTKWFFFPGFTPQTGGLLREPDLLARRDAWQADSRARRMLLESLRLPQTAVQALCQQDLPARQVLLFCYPHAPVAALLQGLMATQTPAVVLASPGAVNDAHRQLVRGSRVQVYDIPFVAQYAFDALLWGSDLNCVRGEDSLVRALWAARPLLWHIYPQADHAHLEKLQAWLARAPYPTPAAQLMHGWNADAPGDFAVSLSQQLAPTAWNDWQAAARQWGQTLAQQTDLATALTAFCAQKHQTR